MDSKHEAINKKLWNERVNAHVDSDFYNMKGFLNGETSLQEIELRLLGDIAGKSLLHLQCHFGQDTISLARMGASCTGVDLSNKAIEKANELTKQTKANAQFLCCNVYDIENHLKQPFDIVFTTYGTIGWLPDINEWARLVAKYLKPGGKLVFVEFHPVVWMFDEALEKVKYCYFNSEPIIETESATYADENAQINLESVGWNHSIGEVTTALLNAGLTIDHLQEYDYSPYDIFGPSTENEPRRFRPKKHGNMLPLVYSITAKK
ncbi:MAG: methyltransferase domain-containing protein [Bacteroidetes bacterium]|nr:methyltransferase domain-containing protein [Bacteroidota bacterium]